MEEAAHAGARRGLEDVDGPLGVDALEGDAGARMLADDAHEVDDGVAALDAFVERPPGRDVALDALDGAQTAQVALGAAPHEAADDAPLGAQRLDDRPPYEAGSAGNEDPADGLHAPQDTPRPSRSVHGAPGAKIAAWSQPR